MQSPLESLIESLLNIGSGFVISMAMWTFVVVPLFAIPITAGQSFWITAIFTVTSVIRSYAWRRIGNYYTIHKNKKLLKETPNVSDRNPR